MGNSSSKAQGKRSKEIEDTEEYKREYKRVYQEHMAIIEAIKAKPIPPREPSPGPGPPDGFTGEHVYRNGDRAKGEFRNGKLNGKGVFYSNAKDNRGWSSSTFVNNKLRGLGKSYNSEDKLSWNVGRFVDGKLREGKRVYHPNSEVEYHEGQFWYDSVSGRGTRVWRNGDRFVGKFENSCIENGQSGVFTWANGESFRGKYYDKGRKYGRARYDAQGKLMDSSYWDDCWLPGNEIEKVVGKPYEAGGGRVMIRRGRASRPVGVRCSIILSTIGLRAGCGIRDHGSLSSFSPSGRLAGRL
jgi:hypothetical protein